MSFLNVSCGIWDWPCLGSRHCLPRSWQTSKLSRFCPTNFTILSQYRLSPNLQMSRSLSQDCLPNMKRTFYIIKPNISWLANIEIVEELVTWWAIARPRMSKSLLFTVFSYLWLGSGTSRGHCDVQILQTERPQNTRGWHEKRIWCQHTWGLTGATTFGIFSRSNWNAECHAQSQSPLCSLPRWCQQPSKYHPNTPWKINMEPTNQPFRKENDLPNLHDYVPC